MSGRWRNQVTATDIGLLSEMNSECLAVVQEQIFALIGALYLNPEAKGSSAKGSSVMCCVEETSSSKTNPRITRMASTVP